MKNCIIDVISAYRTIINMVDQLSVRICRIEALLYNPAKFALCYNRDVLLILLEIRSKIQVGTISLTAFN
jgi:hypothetical protein